MAVQGGSAKATILVVEDTALVRVVLVELLRDCGYAVLEASGSEEALRLLGDSGIPIDMLVSDILMPGRLDGVGLARLGVERRPGLSVLLLTGFAAIDGAGQFRVLSKPYQHDELIGCIEAMLA